MDWYVYVLVSTRRTRTYVGISTDCDRRLRQHNGALPGGAKSTRAGRPWGIGIVYGPFDNRSEASKIEYRVKKLRGRNRLNWSRE